MGGMMKTIETKPRVKIEGWSMSMGLSSPYDAPELAALILMGDVVDHPRFEEGEHVRTSSVIGIDLPNKIVETKNTIYILGEPDSGFIEWLDERGQTLDDYPVTLNS